MDHMHEADILTKAFPDCKVNLDYDGSFAQIPEYLAAQGVINLPYDPNSNNVSALMADTVTIMDSGKETMKELVTRALHAARLATHIMIIRKGAGINGEAYPVCANRPQRQRKVYVC